MYKIVRSEQLADRIYLMDVEAPRVARACRMVKKWMEW